MEILVGKPEIIGTEKFDNEYVICSKKRTNVQNSTLVIFNQLEEIEWTVKLLGRNVSVYLDDYLNKPEIYDWLCITTYTDIENDVKIKSKDYKTIFKIIDKIGISKNTAKMLKEKNERISTDIVHKKSLDNVMISDYIKLKDVNMIYANVFYDTNEIILDHIADDHVEAMLINEFTRQGVMLSAIVAYNDENKNFLIMKEQRRYSKLIDRQKPCILQLFCWVPNKNGIGFSVFNVIQENVSKVKGYYVGYSSDRVQ